MEYIFQGIVLGLTLTILLGPIFIALTQTGIEKGFRAGLTVGAGIWTSDLLVIIVGYIFIREINSVVSDPVFHRWMGLLGGFILIVIGFATFLKKSDLNQNVTAFNAKTLAGFWTKGFIVNFFNPFTFVFWLGVLTTYVVGKGISGTETLLLFGSIMITIMITDSSKVLLAKYLRKKMSGDIVQIAGKIAGIVLFVFGLILLIRTNVLG
ncbi:MAG: LysE family transporter [Saprospiraceae bacterium]|nr:LysE family transporter [Saprospiraceae bacterium]